MHVLEWNGGTVMYKSTKIQIITVLSKKARFVAPWVFCVSAQKHVCWLCSEHHLEHPERGGGEWILSSMLKVCSRPPQQLKSFFSWCHSQSKFKSCDSGPTRARSRFPWSALSWQGLRALSLLASLLALLLHREKKGDGLKVSVSVLLIHPQTLSFSGGWGVGGNRGGRV